MSQRCSSLSTGAAAMISSPRTLADSSKPLLEVSTVEVRSWRALMSWNKSTAPSWMTARSRSRPPQAMRGCVSTQNRPENCPATFSSTSDSMSPASVPFSLGDFRRGLPHTARYHGGEITTRCPFHPCAGETVKVGRRHRFRGVSMFVVIQPDGTLAQIPTRMCAPEAGKMSVTKCSHLRLPDLRTLRMAIDARVSSPSKPNEGEPHGNAPDSSSKRSLIAVV